MAVDVLSGVCGDEGDLVWAKADGGAVFLVPVPEV